MNPERIDVYAACDKAIKSMDRENVEAFGRLRLAKWDEINIIRTVKAVYEASARKARKRYYEVGFEAYLLGMALCDEDPAKAHRMAEKAIDPEWVDAILSDVDMITLYKFDTETERKAYRLAEALEAARNRNAEIDRALRDWSRQLGQYAINVTDYAILQAFVDEGIEKVMWVSERDDRVCKTCHAYDGNVYPIDELPVKPHWGCRCRFLPVRE